MPACRLLMLSPGTIFFVRDTIINYAELDPFNLVCADPLLKPHPRQLTIHNWPITRVQLQDQEENLYRMHRHTSNLIIISAAHALILFTESSDHGCWAQTVSYLFILQVKAGEGFVCVCVPQANQAVRLIPTM